MKRYLPILTLTGCIVATPTDVMYEHHPRNKPMICHPQHEDVWFCTDEQENQYYWHCAIKFGRWQCRLVWR